MTNQKIDEFFASKDDVEWLIHDLTYGPQGKNRQSRIKISINNNCHRKIILLVILKLSYRKLYSSFHLVHFTSVARWLNLILPFLGLRQGGGRGGPILQRSVEP